MRDFRKGVDLVGNGFEPFLWHRHRAQAKSAAEPFGVPERAEAAGRACSHEMPDAVDELALAQSEVPAGVAERLR